jgi:hypothetical protein
MTNESGARIDLSTAASIGLVALAIRGAFAAALGTPPYDPWRHLALIRNLREGLGFTLFDGQPYVWYAPLWYYAAAAIPESIPLEAVTAVLSAATAPLLYLLARRHGAGVAASAVAGGLLALSGPAVAFTTHYGPEAAALLLALGSLTAAAWRPRPAVLLLAGALFGLALVLRLNLAFLALLLLPWIGRPGPALVFGAGTALPLLLQAWRNHRILAAHDWVFTWDGLATPTDGFGPLSTLVIQMHPDVSEALRRLHVQIVPWPEWIVGPGGISWGLLLLMAAGFAGVLGSRRLGVALAAFVPAVYFVLLDRSLSAHFFRIWLGVLPVFFLGIGLHVEETWKRGPGHRVLGAGLVAFALVGGIGLLVPIDAGPIELYTPPQAAIEPGSSYLVNSGRFHPESLVWRYPGARFVGLPLDAERVDEFVADFPAYDRVLWHDFTVQPEVREHLRHAGWSPAGTFVDPVGHTYRVHRRDRR